MALQIPRIFSQAVPRTRRSPIIPTWASARRSFSAEFSPQTYAPDAQYSSNHVSKLLKTSILSEFSEQEAKSRIELAACYRLFGLKGWNENIYGHLTAKVHEDDGSESFLINPFGLLYSEITASSLIKVGADGSVKHPGVTGGLFGINDAGFVIHSAIHRARPDLQSVMHCHYPSAAGVSSLKQGFLELSQTSHQVGPIAYHDYQGVVVDRNEQKSLAEDMGDKNIMFLRNHGVITAGASIGAAWYLMYQLLAATDIQSHASACALGDAENLNMPSDRTVTKTYEVMHKKGFSGAAYGLKELSAYMRLLDKLDGSYRT
ncbi:Adducin-related protein [Aspergillus novofumigatus IBT 16806]|uniref:Adducin-related protein n=1 Tax=Aspergillus novofumigatus (strain IBT 16806) TaxID=1392255 RepID=A0A2I1CGZ8_ASPN1|nr:Adducin-related protein [Aspergillus novofumigatus IBT 16806]PKX96895.1 Adducin-related protein [Aspergillus novofumigatus IBT 16806]